jgi:mannose-6-phosphate isomerase-like protein (cupin superfamily)
MVTSVLTEVRTVANAPEFATDERCFIREVANDSGDEYLSIALARVDTAVTTAWHRLIEISERYIIISGQGLVEVEGIEATTVGPGDVVRIPANTAQRITNTGTDQLLFYAICAPPFNAAAYINLESAG